MLTTQGRTRAVLCRDQQAARKGADRAAFDGAYVLVGEQAGDTNLPQHCLGEAKQHGVVAAQHFTHEKAPWMPRLPPTPPAQRVA